MSNDLNLCQFIGRLGQDPETKYTGNGTAVTNISIACGWKSKDKEGTEWVRVVAFGKLAEIMQQYLNKGSQVYISGRFKTDKYDKDGETRYSTSIVADRLQMLGGKSQGGADKPQREMRDDDGPQTDNNTAGDGFDDIPFAPIDWRCA